MYLCICNAIREGEVREAARTGAASSAAQYLRSRGIAPKCGKCVKEVHEILRSERDSVLGGSAQAIAAR